MQKRNLTRTLAIANANTSGSSTSMEIGSSKGGSARRLLSVSTRARSRATGRQTTLTEEWGKTPRDLHHHLSQYCIGQPLAKKILSVAVFNHYSRIYPILYPPLPPSNEPISSTLDFSSSSSATTSSNPTTDLANSSSSSTGKRRPGRPPKIDVEALTGGRGVGAEGTEREAASGTGSASASGIGKGMLPDLAGMLEREKDPDPTMIHDPTVGTGGAGAGAWETSGRGFYTRMPPPEPPTLGVMARLRGQLLAAASTSPPVSGPSTDRHSPPSFSSGATYDEEPPSNRGTISPDDDLRDVVVEKSNVLMLGPTGSGKTLLAKTLARILDVPFASSDATGFTQAGYVGEDVESCVLRLLKAADYDVARAEVGIIHIDECDKLARRGGGGGGDGGSWGGRDVAGEGVQQALLKLLEGSTVTLQAKPPPQASTPPSANSTSSSSSSSHHFTPSSAFDHPDPIQRGFGSGPATDYGARKGVREGLPAHGGGGSSGGGPGGKGETFMVDTSNILFILSGSFVGLEKMIARRIGKGSMGFNAVLPKVQKTSEQEDEIHVEVPGEDESKRISRLEGLTTGDLIEYGFIPEFVGRLPVLAPLHPLSLNDLVRVLTEPKNALIKQYRKTLERHGCELRFSKNALVAIASKASKKGGSARHLRGTLEEILLDCMYEIPGSSVRFAAITAAVARKESPALYFSRGQRSAFDQTLEEDDRPASEEMSFGFEDDTEEEKLTATG